MSKKASLYILMILFIISLSLILFFRYKPVAPVTPTSDKLTIVTSFYPLYYFAQEIGGARAIVTDITPAGAEPHDYEPTAQDIARIESSRILIISGNGLEAWAENIKDNIDPAQTKLITAGEGLADQGAAGNQGTIDPHIWLDPNLAQKMVDRITLGLTEADPQNSKYYQSNATVLKSKLAKLDGDFRAGLSHCRNKDIITAHAAFAYLARAYNLNQIAITGLAPEAEASPRQMADISKLARNNKIRYICFENLVSPKLAQTIASEIGAQTLALNPLEGLSEADLAAHKDYLSEMENNLTNLKTALTCQ